MNLSLLSINEKATPIFEIKSFLILLFSGMHDAARLNTRCEFMSNSFITRSDEAQTEAKARRHLVGFVFFS